MAPQKPVTTVKVSEQQLHSLAVKEIERLGGNVSCHKDRNGNPYVNVRIGAGWKGGMKGLIHLVSLKNLKALDLNVSVDEKALEHVEQLTTIESLWLRKAEKLTDDSLASLKPLTNLKRLALFNPQITVDGMKHLKGLKQLTYVVLRPRKKYYSGRDRARLRRLLPQVVDW